MSFPLLYERVLVPALFEPWAALLLDRAPLAPDAHVLDVGCGTGIVARLARRRAGQGARIVGVDHSAPFLDVARGLDPSIDWREGDAAALPVADDERFDVVVCHQTLQFVPDRPAAVRAMRRVLAPGGHVAIGVWRSLEENSLFHELGTIAERIVGPIHDARHAFADDAALASLLCVAGLTDVRVEPLSLDTRFAMSPADFAHLNAMSVVGMSTAWKGTTPAERAGVVSAIVAASLPTVERWLVDDAIVVRTAANLASARAAG